MLMSLENMCRKLLRIDENVSVIDIVNFLKRNKIYNPKSLFLVNFKYKRTISLNSPKRICGYGHEILGFKKMYGEYEDYYHIYCRINNGPMTVGYKIYITNRELTRKIDLRSHEKIDLGINLFLRTPCDHTKNIFFILYEFKKRGGKYLKICFPFE